VIARSRQTGADRRSTVVGERRLRKKSRVFIGERALPGAISWRAANSSVRRRVSWLPTGEAIAESWPKSMGTYCTAMGSTSTPNRCKRLRRFSDAR
jgi:hypothetical protein